MKISEEMMARLQAVASALEPICDADPDNEPLVHAYLDLCQIICVVRIEDAWEKRQVQND